MGFASNGPGAWLGFDHSFLISFTSLTQADLAFVRRASKILKRLRQEDLALSDLELRDAALESLPALREYRARELAKRLEDSFGAAPAVARPRL